MATVTPATEESIKLWLKIGNLKKLEQAVLDGYGDQLRGRNSRIPKINKFLKRVPHFQSKIAAIHDAMAQGNMRNMDILLDRKGLVFARGNLGGTPFHTAILYKRVPIIQYLLEKYPHVLQARDHHGRTPLHYAALLDDGGEIFNMLVDAGADKEAKDLLGKTPNDYQQNPQEYQLPSLGKTVPYQKAHSREVSSMLRQPSPIALMTKTEIRSMIQKGDIARLERAILHGYGERLLGEKAISTRVKELLESIPEHLNKLAALQMAIESGSLRDIQSLLNRKELVTARDTQGLTVLHKAVLYNRKEIVEYLISLCPKAIFSKDHDKRTPVHYAAALNDDGVIYNILIQAGGNTSLPDCDGKTPEFYRQNSGSLDLKKVIERRLEGSGKLSNSTSNSNGHSKSSIKSGRRDPSGANARKCQSSVKQWLRSGDIEKLEQVVIDGYGLQLIRETTADPRARAFLRTVPAYVTKIGSIHESVCMGSLRNLQVLLDRKKMAMSRDQMGLGLLHKSVLYGHTDIIQYLLKNHPETMTIKDKYGRTPLHFAAAVKNKEDIYPMLIEAGADPNQTDLKEYAPDHYYNNNDLDIDEILLRVNKQRRGRGSINAGKQIGPIPVKLHDNGFHINGANIRKWIHAEDIQKLEQVVLEGQGYKLLLETSNNPRVKHFLVGVPSLVNKIRDIHNAVALGELQGVESSIERPSLLVSKDEVGMTPLHKAVLLEHEEIMQFIINTNNLSLQAKDEEGRTALHYAAGLKDGGRTYEMLEKAGADAELADNREKSAEHYLKHPGELDMRQLMSHVHRCKPTAVGKQEANANLPNKRQAPPNLRPVRKVSNNNPSLTTNETITRIIQQGDTEALEQLVLDGYGKRLIGKSSWNEDVRIFLKKVPHYMDRIYAVHTAAAVGDLLLLQQLLDKKKLVLSKDEYGLTALHKAVKYGQMNVVKYLLQTFPSCHEARDQDGRTPLHYAALYKDRKDIYQLLVNNGADCNVQDHRKKTPEQYLNSHAKLEAPPPPKPFEKGQKDSNEETKSDNGVDLIEDDREIEEWIQNGDIKRLEILLLQGRGERLLGKTSEDDKTQEFLEAVPAYMGKIRAIHNAAANGDTKDLQSLIDKNVLAVSQDEHGASPLHRAVLHGHKETIKFLANNYPKSLKVKDKNGLTPLHYAALFNDGHFYRLVNNCGANPNVKDKKGNTPGQMLRGNGAQSLEELLKRYEEKKVPPRPHSVQMWERPPTEEILSALTPSPMPAEHIKALKNQDDKRTDCNEHEADASNEPEAGHINDEETYYTKDEESDSADNEEPHLTNEEDAHLRKDEEQELNADKEETDEPQNMLNADEDSHEKGDQAEQLDDSKNSDSNLPNKEVKEPDTVRPETPTSYDNRILKKEESDKEIDNTERAESGKEGDTEDTESDESDNTNPNSPSPESDAESDNHTADEAENADQEATKKDFELLETGEDKGNKSLEHMENAAKEMEANTEADGPPEETVDETEGTSQDTEESKPLMEEPPADNVASPIPQNTETDNLGLSQGNTESLELQKENVDPEPKHMEDLAEPQKDMEDLVVPQKDIKNLVEPQKDGVSTKVQEDSTVPEADNSDNPNENVTSSEEANNNSLIRLDTFPFDDVHSSKEGDYLTTVLGDALITAMAEVSRIKPENPIAYLSVLLYRYLHKSDIQGNEPEKDDYTDDVVIMKGNRVYTSTRRKSRLLSGQEGIVDITNLAKVKESDGSTLLHYVAKKSHKDDAFFQLLCQTHCNLAERNNFYSTIRDVASESNQQANVEAIDRYVFHLIREGRASDIAELIMDGYNHIVDIEDDEGNDSIMVAELSHQPEIVQQLKGIGKFQEKLELLHESIRNGNTEEVKTLLEKNPTLGRAKNAKGQTAIHMAILTENAELVKLITSICPKGVNVQDNMGRTPLHYSMGTSNPPAFSKILVQQGGSKMIRDATSHLASYYFINNRDIQRLKQELEETRV